MILISNNQLIKEKKYPSEEEFERDVVNSSILFFGENTIYIDAKKKIGSESLGNTIPDGFLFDMSDSENREFYLVEVELESHDFYKHIFPQITKFFAFFKNSKRQKELVEKLFSTINTDNNLKKQFKKYLGEKEIFKFLNDIVDSSQNILLLIDGEKPELPEIVDTYSDTWGKMVKVMTIKKFQNKEETIFTVEPEFETIEYSIPTEERDGEKKYSEEFHLEGVKDNVREIYSELKRRVLSIDSSFIFNPQKYYISIKGIKNIAYLEIRKKMIRLMILLPDDIVRAKIKKHKIVSLSEPVQKFYNAPSSSLYLYDLKNLDEVIDLITILMKKYSLISENNS